MKYREVTQKLRVLGCEELVRRSGGSQRKWHKPGDGPNGFRARLGQ